MMDDRRDRVMGWRRNHYLILHFSEGAAASFHLGAAASLPTIQPCPQAMTYQDLGRKSAINSLNLQKIPDFHPIRDQGASPRHAACSRRPSPPRPATGVPPRYMHKVPHHATPRCMKKTPHTQGALPRYMHKAPYHATPRCMKKAPQYATLHAPGTPTENKVIRILLTLILSIISYARKLRPRPGNTAAVLDGVWR